MNFPPIMRTETDREIQAMFGDAAWIVGGRPRDEFFAAQRGERIESKDHDYVVTGRSHEDIVETLKRAGWTADLVGASFGVVKARKGDLEVDVSMPRRERSTGDGHKDFAIEAHPDIPLREDMLRRDVTWGAVAVNVATSEVVSAPMALEDLETRTIRVVGPNAIREDPLRMLRIVQFDARFEGKIEDATRADVQRHAESIRTVAAERLQEEIDKLMLRSRRPSIGWRAMHDLGMLDHVAPEYVPAIGLKQNTYHELDVWGHDLSALDLAARTIREGGLERAAATGTLEEKALAKILLYGAFLHDVGKPETAQWVSDEYGNSFHKHEAVGASMARRMLERWKFPQFEAEAIAGLVANHMYPHESLMKIGGGGTERAIRRLLRTAAENQPMALETWWEVQFLVRGCDVRGGKRDAVWHATDLNHQFCNQVREVLTQVPALTVRDLAIDGPAVIEAFVAEGWEEPGWKGGRSISACLRACVDAVVDDPRRNVPEELLEVVKEEARTRFYVIDASRAKEPTMGRPSLLTFAHQDAVAHVGYVAAEVEGGPVVGGFVRFERDGVPHSELRGIDVPRMKRCLGKMGVGTRDVARVVAAMKMRMERMPETTFSIRGTAVDVIDLMEPDRRIVVVGADGRIVERSGLPNESVMAEIVGDSDAAREIHERLHGLRTFAGHVGEAIKERGRGAGASGGR